MTDNKSIPKDSSAKAVAKMQQAFCADFVPMVQKIQYDVSVMNCFGDEKSKKYYIDDINSQLDKAMSLLKQIKNFADKVLEEDD
ncbi:MAG: hypothetical protein IJ529_03625 [Alphaproteobacteria bacterium]|nr:hypothetical protein [Alphaproteobacteria bacterium]